MSSHDLDGMGWDGIQIQPIQWIKEAADPVESHPVISIDGKGK